jgi:hypothetical protein
MPCIALCFPVKRDNSSATKTQIVLQAHLGISNLALARFTTQLLRHTTTHTRSRLTARVRSSYEALGVDTAHTHLPTQLSALREAGASEWVTFRDEATRRVDDPAPTVSAVT